MTFLRLWQPLAEQQKNYKETAMKDYVQEAIDKGKLVKDKVANIQKLADLNGVPMAEAKWFVAALKKDNKQAIEVKLVLNLREEDRQQRMLDEYLEKRHPLNTLNGAIESLQDELNKYFDKAKADPFYNLSWGLGAFEAAAKHKVYRGLLYYFESDPTEDRWNAILAETRKEALQKASSPQRSTSPTSNLADQCEMKALANIVAGHDFTIGEIKYWFSERAKYLARVEEWKADVKAAMALGIKI